MQANLIFRRLVWPLDVVVERGLQIDRLLAEFHNLPNAETQRNHPFIAVSLPVCGYHRSEGQIPARVAGKIEVDEGLKQELIDVSATIVLADGPDIVEQATDDPRARYF